MKKSECAIVGGGIAGLALSICLAQKGVEVSVFEKNNFPNHKVCGEYVSRESEPFLDRLGILDKMSNCPQINKLSVSAPNGKLFSSNMKMGGIGISRFMFDNLLYQRAVELGVNFIFEEVTDINKNTDSFEIKTKNNAFIFKRVFAAFGKRSNLDVKWERGFALKAKNRLNQWVGVKYHINLDEVPTNSIALHNFEGGYCGISKIENNKVCLCYLVNSKMIQNRTIQTLETEVLSKNPHLEHIYNTADFIFDKPLAISQISFDKKEQVINGIPMLGDAAGLITPLCGNGMSLALHSAAILAKYYENKDTNALYEKEWNNLIAKRLFWGRLIQKGFGNNTMSNLLIATANIFPGMGNYLVEKSHGKEF